ncbi:MAG: DUF2147 domain-containing protein [Pedobacter sp.]|nr:MAG: DUF2147 domain-containing protein [Pedobacter sp.]
MIHKLSLIILFTIFTLGVKAQKFEGTWLNSSKEGRIEIVKKGNAYFGKLIWIKEPNDEQGKPKLDKNNPNPQLRNKALIGTEIIKDMKLNGAVLEDGSVYDPKTGKTYSCRIKLVGSDKMELRGYVGISMLGRTEVWTRVK